MKPQTLTAVANPAKYLHHVTVKEANVILDRYFAKLEKEILPLVKQLAALPAPAPAMTTQQIRADMRSFRSQLRSFINKKDPQKSEVKQQPAPVKSGTRVPFKALRKPSGQKVPFHKADLKRTK